MERTLPANTAKNPSAPGRRIRGKDQLWNTAVQELARLPWRRMARDQWRLFVYQPWHRIVVLRRGRHVLGSATALAAVTSEPKKEGPGRGPSQRC